MNASDTTLTAISSVASDTVSANKVLTMDPGERFTFRGLLYSDTFGSEPQRHVEEALRHVVAQQSGLSSAQIYDRLYADLCGTEPLEHGPLMRFMRLCIAAIKELTLRVAESAEVPSDDSSAKGTPVDDVVVNPTLAAIDPVQMLRRLAAIQHVAPSDTTDGGLIVHLAVFLGCTDTEIAGLMRFPLDKVVLTRGSRFLEILKREAPPRRRRRFHVDPDASLTPPTQVKSSRLRMPTIRDRQAARPMLHERDTMQQPSSQSSGPRTELEQRIGEVFRRIPVLPSMTEAEQLAARLARDKLADEEFPNPDERQAAADLFKWLESPRKPTQDDLEGIPESDLWLPVSAKDYLSGYYPVETKPIGEGVAAQVYKCRTRFGGYTAVIKLMTISDAEHRIGKMLAIRELQTILRLHHPNIVRVFDAGRISVPDGRGGREDYPFVSMEFLDGVTLWDWVVSNHPVNANSSSKEQRHWETMVAQVGAVLADTLSFCHRNGVTHGDFHARNIHVCGVTPTPETLKVYDFGFAAGTSEGVGGRRAQFGKSQAAELGWKSLKALDIRALGETVYSCLTKRTLAPLPQDEQRGDALDSQLSTIQSDDLRAVLRMALMTGFVEEGYEDVADLADDLRAVAQLRPVLHARPNGYSLWERERLVWLRAREIDIEDNQLQIIARLAVFMGGLASLNGILHALQVYQGVPSDLANQRSNNPVLGIALIVFGVTAWWTRGRFATLRIVEPLVAFVVCCACLLFRVMPDTFGTAPDLEAMNSACLVAIMLLGLINNCFGTLSSDWRELRVFGWAVVGMTFLLRPLFESDIKSYAGPEFTAAVEAIVCFLFARRLWNAGALSIPKKTTLVNQTV